MDARTMTIEGRMPELQGMSVLMAADGSFGVTTVSPSLSRAGQPPVLLLDRTGAPTEAQLGGIPPGTYVYGDISISPDSGHVAVYLRSETSLSGVLGIWDATAPERPVALLDAGPWSAPLVDGSGRRLFVVGEAGLGVLDLPSGRERRVVTPDDLRVLSIDPVLGLSPDGRLLAVGAGPQALLLDARSLALRASIRVPGGADRVDFSRSGRLLAISGDDTSVFDVSSVEEPIEVFSLADTRADGGWVSWVGFSPNETTMYSSDRDGSVRASDLGGGRAFLASRRAPGAVVPAAAPGRLSADGTRLLHCGWAPGLVVEDLERASTTGFVDPDMRINGSMDCAISTDGGLVTITTSDPRVAVWDDAGRLVQSLRLPGGEGASFSWFTNDGRLVVGTTKGRMLVFEARTLKQRRPPIDATPGESIYSFALRPGGREALVLTGEGTVVDFDSGAIRASGLGVDVGAAAYSPDGARLAVTTSDGSVGLWDVEHGDWIAPPNDAEPFSGFAVSFSADGREFAIPGSGRVGRWDGLTGDFLGAVTVGVDATPGYSPDGTRLLMAGADDRVYSWDLDPESWVAAACRMAGRDLTAQEWEAQMPDRPQEELCPPVASP
jgi:WD40 repeat protein